MTMVKEMSLKLRRIDEVLPLGGIVFRDGQEYNMDFDDLRNEIPCE